MRMRRVHNSAHHEAICSLSPGEQELESDEEGVAEELFPVKNDGCQVEKGTMKKPPLDSIHPRKKGFFRTTMGSLLLTSVLKV